MAGIDDGRRLDTRNDFLHAREELLAAGGLPFWSELGLGETRLAEHAASLENSARLVSLSSDGGRLNQRPLKLSLGFRYALPPRRALQLSAGVDLDFITKTAIYCRKRGFMKDMPVLLCTTPCCSHGCLSIYPQLAAPLSVGPLPLQRSHRLGTDWW